MQFQYVSTKIYSIDVKEQSFINEKTLYIDFP